jgi:hypothetical protein
VHTGQADESLREVRKDLKKVRAALRLVRAELGETTYHALLFVSCGRQGGGAQSSAERPMPGSAPGTAGRVFTLAREELSWAEARSIHASKWWSGGDHDGMRDAALSGEPPSSMRYPMISLEVLLLIAILSTTIAVALVFMIGCRSVPQVAARPARPEHPSRR